MEPQEIKTIVVVFRLLEMISLILGVSVPFFEQIKILVRYILFLLSQVLFYFTFQNFLSKIFLFSEIFLCCNYYFFKDNVFRGKIVCYDYP